MRNPLLGVGLIGIAGLAYGAAPGSFGAPPNLSGFATVAALNNEATTARANEAAAVGAASSATNAAASAASAVASEATNRASAVAGLQSTVTSETTARLAAVQAEASTRAAAVAAVPTDYLGAYTIAAPGLPNAAANAGKRILVTDLGGGPGYLRATNGCWKRVSTTTAAVQSVPVGATVTVDGLAMSPIIGLTGSSFAAKATITITNACSVPQLTVVSAANVFSALGSLGLSTGGTPIAVAGIGVQGTWNDYAVSADGTTLTKIRGGSL